MKQKIWLNEVSFMRPFLLILLVSYHAFAPYCGAWNMPNGIQSVESYRWIALFSRAFRLEAFVFISGYIFTFQLLSKHKFDNILILAKNKAQRLLIPCIIFGAFYYVIFYDNIDLNGIFRIFTGVGHLWYLPCLLWLFLIQFMIIKWQSNGKLKLSMVFAVALLLPSISIIPFPFQLNRALYYLIFFMGGDFLPIFNTNCK